MRHKQGNNINVIKLAVLHNLLMINNITRKTNLLVFTKPTTVNNLLITVKSDINHYFYSHKTRQKHICGHITGSVLSHFNI